MSKTKDFWDKVAFYTFSRQAWRRYADRVVRFFCGVLLVATLFFTVCVLFAFTREFIVSCWRPDVSVAGVRNMQEFWQMYTPLLKAFFYSLTLLIACHTLIKYTDVETCRSLGEIRTKLNENPKKVIHNSLLDPVYREKLQEQVDIYFKDHPEEKAAAGLSGVEFLDYLGTLELGAIMLQRGILSENEFFDQFGYRYVYLSRSPIIDMIMEKEEKQFYEPLLYAMDVANKRNEEIKTKNKKNTEEKDLGNSGATA